MNDLILFGKNMNDINELKQFLKKEFEMKNMRELQYFLGIQIHRNRKNQQLQIHQHDYINMILKHFGMKNSSSASILTTTDTKLVKLTKESIIDQKQYQSNIDNQMYEILCTKSNLM